MIEEGKRIGRIEGGLKYEGPFGGEKIEEVIKEGQIQGTFMGL